jgi:hypothetical protein
MGGGGLFDFWSDQSQSLPITFCGSANCPMKRRAENFMSSAVRTLQVWGNEGGTHMHDIHDGMLESRLSLDSGKSRGCHKNSKKVRVLVE